jgi:GNAT superfamily N-acetyltransferase
MGNAAVLQSSRLEARDTPETDAELAVIAERVEQQAWKDIVDAAPPDLRSALGLVAEERNGVLLVAAPGTSHLLLNRVIGLGRQAPATDAQIQALIERFDRLGVNEYWVHVCPYARPSRLGRHLQLHGLHPYRRSWVKMLGRIPRTSPQRTAVHVRTATAEDGAAVASILGLGFDMEQRCAELFVPLIERSGWKILVAEIEGQIAAAAGLYIHGDTGYLAFAATRPEWRRHGAQQSLIEARIHAAGQAGCRWIASETGFPLLATEISPSYHNMLRAGLRPVSIRDNYAPPGTQWRVLEGAD